MRTEKSYEQLNRLASFLRDRVAEKIQEKPQYSVRQLALKLQVSHSFLSQVLAGKKKLSFDRGLQMSHALGLDENNKLEFMEILKEINSDVIPVHFLHLFKQDNLINDFKIDNVELLKVFHHWYHIAILDLTGCDNFKSDRDWIAKRLGISRIEVISATDRLLKLGFLKEKNGRLTKSVKKLSFPTKKSHYWMRNLHLQMIQKAIVHLEKEHAQSSFNKRDVTGITMAIDPNKIEEAKLIIKEFRQNMSRFLMSGKCTEVYQLNIQFFPLTKEIQKNNND